MGERAGVAAAGIGGLAAAVFAVRAVATARAIVSGATAGGWKARRSCGDHTAARRGLRQNAGPAASAYGLAPARITKKVSR